MKGQRRKWEDWMLHKPLADVTQDRMDLKKLRSLATFPSKETEVNGGEIRTLRGGR